MFAVGHRTADTIQPTLSREEFTLSLTHRNSFSDYYRNKGNIEEKSSVMRASQCRTRKPCGCDAKPRNIARDIGQPVATLPNFCRMGKL